MSTQSQTSSTSSVINLNDDKRERLHSKSLFEKALFRLSHDRLTLLAGTVIILLALLSILAPFISTQILQVDYSEINNYETFGKPGEYEGHILGTDELGRDHLARLLYGGRVSLGIGFAAAALSLLIGVTLGVLTGFYGGAFDDLMIWFITTLNSIPQTMLLLTIASILDRGPTTLTLILAFLSWTGTMRLVRGETLSLREREFVVAARAIGASNVRIMFLHIVPNVISLVIITLAITIGGLILTESGLSFLGFGVPSSTAPSWGNMLNAGLELIRLAPHLVIFPGLMIGITVLCLYVVGDGLRDAFDPRIAD